MMYQKCFLETKEENQKPCMRPRWWATTTGARRSRGALWVRALPPLELTAGQQDARLAAFQRSAQPGPRPAALWLGGARALGALTLCAAAAR